MTDGKRDLELAVLEQLRDGEKAYPIYKVEIRWSEAYAPDAKPYKQSGLPPLPEGRFWNSTGWSYMSREDRDPEQIKAELIQAWWPAYSAKRLEPADVTVTVMLDRRDVWCSGWFSHWTFDVGMDDFDVIASFMRYVDRIQRSYLTETEKGGILMGAEDDWRWHGCVDGNPQGERTEAPCRCPGCKKRGVVRIDH